MHREQALLEVVTNARCPFEFLEVARDDKFPVALVRWALSLNSSDGPRAGRKPLVELVFGVVDAPLGEVLVDTGHGELEAVLKAVAPRDYVRMNRVVCASIVLMLEDFGLGSGVTFLTGYGPSVLVVVRTMRWIGIGEGLYLAQTWSVAVGAV